MRQVVVVALPPENFANHLQTGFHHWRGQRIDLEPLKRKIPPEASAQIKRTIMTQLALLGQRQKKNLRWRCCLHRHSPLHPRRWRCCLHRRSPSRQTRWRCCRRRRSPVASAPLAVFVIATAHGSKINRDSVGINTAKIISHCATAGNRRAPPHRRKHNYPTHRQLHLGAPLTLFSNGQTGDI